MQAPTTSHGRTLSGETTGSYVGQRNRRPRLGQILVEAGLVKVDVLHRCVSAARRTNQKLGVILVNEQRISYQDLQSALMAQSFIADGVVGENAAARILGLASKKKIDLQAAIKEVDPEEDRSPLAVPELPEILVESGLIKFAAIERARSLANASGMPFGKTLLVTNAITTAALDAILHAVVLIRNGSVMKRDVVKSIKELRRNRLEVTRENLQLSVDEVSGTPVLGQMLVNSKCLSDFECLSAIENSLASSRRLGELLVKSGLVAETVLSEALLLQHFASLGVLSQEQATFALRRIEREGFTLRGLARESDLFRDDESSIAALKLLSTAGFVSVPMIVKAMERQFEFQMDASKALVASGMLSAQLLACAKSCVTHIQKGILTQEQALKVLHEMQSQGNTERAVERVLAPGRVAEERKRAELAEKDPILSAQRAFTDWLNYPEFKALVGAVLLVGMAMVATHGLSPEHRALSLCGVLAVASFMLIKIGLSWDKRKADRADSESVRLESARQTVCRMAKANR